MAEVIEITVTTVSTEESPVSGNVTVGRGILQNSRIRFAAGVNGSNKVRIYKGASMLFPRTADGYFRLVLSPIEINDREPLTDSLTVIYLKGWSDGASFQHRVRFEFDVIPFDDPELIL